MKTMILGALGAASLLALMPLLVFGPASAGASTAFELEHARANARAGGPISEYDAELLERWGNSTGGPDWRLQYRARHTNRPQSLYDDDGRPAGGHRHKRTHRVERD